MPHPRPALPLARPRFPSGTRTHPLEHPLPLDRDLVRRAQELDHPRHHIAQPDGAAAGASELRDVVARMTEFLGAVHQYTAKWQRVLEGMSAAS